MTDKKIWFITGAARGMGVDFAKAALAAGHAVVGTGRDPDALAKAVGESDDLLVVKLDVTSRADAEAAVRAAVNRFGRIDVLVNNAGNFFAGYFEDLTPEQIDRQLGTLLIGPLNVTRAVLPVMRKQRAGHMISISSTARLVGFVFLSAYAAANFRPLSPSTWPRSRSPHETPHGSGRVAFRARFAIRPPRGGHRRINARFPDNDHHAKWLAAFQHGISSILHGLGTHRPPVPGE